MPIGVTDLVLLGPLFSPNVKTPTAEWPEKRVGKKPQSIQYGMAQKGQGVDPEREKKRAVSQVMALWASKVWANRTADLCLS